MSEIKWVQCPECGCEQEDMGRNVQCDHCGFGPMPSEADALPLPTITPDKPFKGQPTPRRRKPV